MWISAEHQSWCQAYMYTYSSQTRRGSRTVKILRFAGCDVMSTKLIFPVSKTIQYMYPYRCTGSLIYRPGRRCTRSKNWQRRIAALSRHSRHIAADRHWRFFVSPQVGSTGISTSHRSTFILTLSRKQSVYSFLTCDESGDVKPLIFP